MINNLTMFIRMTPFLLILSLFKNMNLLLIINLFYLLYLNNLNLFMYPKDQNFIILNYQIYLQLILVNYILNQLFYEILKTNKTLHILLVDLHILFNLIILIHVLLFNLLMIYHLFINN